MRYFITIESEGGSATVEVSRELLVTGDMAVLLEHLDERQCSVVAPIVDPRGIRSRDRDYRPVRSGDG